MIPIKLTLVLNKFRFQSFQLIIIKNPNMSDLQKIKHSKMFVLQKRMIKKYIH